MLQIGLTDEVHTTVKYISASGIYLDAGRLHGVCAGDRVDVMRSDSLLAILEVQFVADGSSSCRLLESTGVIRVGDLAVISVAFPTSADTLISRPETLPESVNEEPVLRPERRNTRANRFSGRVGFTSMWQEDRAESSNNIAQPALTVRVRAENLLSTRHTMSIRLRGRQTIRDREWNDHDHRRWTGRIYEWSLTFDDPRSVVRYGAGRVLTNPLRGIGYFDGAFFDYRAANHITVGIFGGTEPDKRTTEFNTSETKYGIYGSFYRGSGTGHQFTATLAMAGRYVEGNVNREFVYEQMDYSIGSKFWLLQSAELNINRKWRAETGSSAVEFVNALFSLRYNVTSDWSASLSYDNRQNYRTWETKDTPDSLFENSRRAGVRFNLRWRALESVSIGGGYGSRMSTVQDRNAVTFTGDVLWTDALMNGVTVSTSVIGFSNVYTKGTQPSLAVSKNVIPSLMTMLQVGRNEYEYRTVSEKVRNDWIKLRLDARLTAHLYGAAYVEHYEGDSPALNRLFLETGFRW